MLSYNILLFLHYVSVKGSSHKVSWVLSMATQSIFFLELLIVCGIVLWSDSDRVSMIYAVYTY